MLLSSSLRNFASAALLQARLLLENRTQRGVSELRYVCNKFFPNPGLGVPGTFSLFAKGLAMAQQQSLQRRLVAFAIDIHLFTARAVKRERRKGSSRRQQTADGAAVNEVERELLHSALAEERKWRPKVHEA